MREDFVLRSTFINMYYTDPWLLLMYYHYGLTSPINEYLLRGTYVEKVLDDILIKKEVNVVDYYDKLLDECFDKGVSINLTYDDFIKYVNNCVPFFKDKELISSQGPLRGEINGTKIEGRYDYFIKHNNETMIVDLKTTSKIPGLVSRGPRKGMLPTTRSGNVRQMAIYRYLNQKESGIKENITLLYVSPDGCLPYTLNDQELNDSLEDVINTIPKINELLSITIEEAAMVCRPKSVWGWSQEMKDKLKEVWNYE